MWNAELHYYCDMLLAFNLRETEAKIEAKRAGALLEAMDNERFRDVFGKDIEAQIDRLSAQIGE